jgi:hypothetical protein
MTRFTDYIARINTLPALTYSIYTFDTESKVLSTQGPFISLIDQLNYLSLVRALINTLFHVEKRHLSLK